VWTTYAAIGEENAGEAAKLVEDLGYGTFWLGGSPRLPTVRPLLEATQRLVVATGIVNVWQYEPSELAAEHEQLAPEFPARLLLGIGVGHPEATSEYVGPLSKMRDFFDGLDGAPTPVPRDERCMAALGLKMLELSAERSLGTLTYFVSVEHTRFARESIGETALIATELACVVDADADRARAKARGYASRYLGLSNYTNNLRKFGFTDEDIGDGGSDRLIDAVIPHGTGEEIAAVAHQHLNAGANHVCLQPIGVNGVPREEWTALSAALVR
jgi:probable F420-dependent oxidoreductase